jgi:hypothetical protein
LDDVRAMPNASIYAWYRHGQYEVCGPDFWQANAD